MFLSGCKREAALGACGPPFHVLCTPPCVRRDNRHEHAVKTNEPSRLQGTNKRLKMLEPPVCHHHFIRLKMGLFLNGHCALGGLVNLLAHLVGTCGWLAVNPHRNFAPFFGRPRIPTQDMSDLPSTSRKYIYEGNEKIPWPKGGRADIPAQIYLCDAPHVRGSA